MAEKAINTEINNEEARKKRFKRVAERRTNNILKQLHILGNCSNKSSYSYNEDDIKKIFSVIEAELRSARARFTFNSKQVFKL